MGHRMSVAEMPGDRRDHLASSKRVKRHRVVACLAIPIASIDGLHGGERRARRSLWLSVILTHRHEVCIVHLVGYVCPRCPVFDVGTYFLLPG